MTYSIDIYVPGGTVSYTTGVGGVSNINVHFYFANVVFIVISFDDLHTEKYYQVPCKYTITP
jgi:hypothetical protein